MIRVALHLADVERQRRHHVAPGPRTLDSTIRFGVAIAPQNSVSTTWQVNAGACCASASDQQVVRADVRAVPVGVVREEHDRGLVLGEDARDHVDRRAASAPDRRCASAALIFSSPPGTVATSSKPR